MHLSNRFLCPCSRHLKHSSLTLDPEIEIKFRRVFSACNPSMRLIHWPFSCLSSQRLRFRIEQCWSTVSRHIEAPTCDKFVLVSGVLTPGIVLQILRTKALERRTGGYWPQIESYVTLMHYGTEISSGRGAVVYLEPRRQGQTHSMDWCRPGRYERSRRGKGGQRGGETRYYVLRIKSRGWRMLQRPRIGGSSIWNG